MIIKIIITCLLNFAVDKVKRSKPTPICAFLTNDNEGTRSLYEFQINAETVHVY